MNKMRTNSLPNNGILRHKNWKKIRRSNYSIAAKEKKQKLNSSDNSKQSTKDSIKIRGINSSDRNHKIDIQANTGRVDQFKNPIIRGKKKHKVSFARKYETISVENWKKINSKLTMKINKNKGCMVCTIF